MAGIRVKQAEADADTVIVSTALAVVEAEERPVVVVGTDTDLLVMLVARASATTDVYMKCCSNPEMIFSINEIQHSIGDTRNHLMALHAVTGCDTVSAIYRRGKKAPFNIVHTRNMNMTCWILSPTTEAHTKRFKELGKALFSSSIGPATSNHSMYTVTLHTNGQSAAVLLIHHLSWRVYLQQVLQQSNIHFALS